MIFKNMIELCSSEGLEMCTKVARGKVYEEMTVDSDTTRYKSAPGHNG